MTVDVPYSLGQELFYIRPCSKLHENKIITVYEIEKVPVTHLHVHISRKETEVEVYVEINGISLNRSFITVFDTEEEAIQKANELNSQRESKHLQTETTGD